MKKMIYVFLVPFFLFLIIYAKNQSDEYIVDSSMTFSEAIKGTKAPEDLKNKLKLLEVKYYSFDGKLHKGQLVVHKDVYDDVREIFELIYKEHFPVAKIIPIVKYDWDDEASMEDNNTSSFNYRFIAGTNRFSNHAFGKAVDINPFSNPVIYSDGRISPKGAEYNPDGKGVFTKDNVIVKEFIRLGWRWGGNFTNSKDYQHFDKNQN